MNNLSDAEIIKALECCNKENGCHECPYEFACYDDKYRSILSKDALALINRQKAEIEELNIELKAMRNAANSYKSKTKTLEMDNGQLHSDIVNANQNFDHIKGLWEAEKEKVEKAKQKVINVCKELQTAKAENERLKYNLKAVLDERADHSEVVKGFAERLKKEIFCMTHINGNVYSDSVVRVLDNLVKEMTENEGKE